jgi:hypothetical protein
MMSLKAAASVSAPLSISMVNSAAPEETTEARASSALVRDASSVPLVTTTRFGWSSSRASNSPVALRTASHVAR